MYGRVVINDFIFVDRAKYTIRKNTKKGTFNIYRDGVWVTSTYDKPTADKAVIEIKKAANPLKHLKCLALVCLSNSLNQLFKYRKNPDIKFIPSFKADDQLYEEALKIITHFKHGEQKSLWLPLTYHLEIDKLMNIDLTYKDIMKIIINMSEFYTDRNIKLMYDGKEISTFRNGKEI